MPALTPGVCSLERRSSTPQYPLALSNVAPCPLGAALPGVPPTDMVPPFLSKAPSCSGFTPAALLKPAGNRAPPSAPPLQAPPATLLRPGWWPRPFASPPRPPGLWLAVRRGLLPTFEAKQAFSRLVCVSSWISPSTKRRYCCLLGVVCGALQPTNLGSSLDFSTFQLCAPHYLASSPSQAHPSQSP